MNSSESINCCEFTFNEIQERIANILLEQRIHPCVLIHNAGYVKDIFTKISDEILTSIHSKHQILGSIKSCEPVK